MEPDLPQTDGLSLAVTARASRSRTRQRGQGLIMFVAAIVFLIGLLAIVVDVTWYWANSLKVQRAADAAALAGAVLLPECPLSSSPGGSCALHNAQDTALASAQQNGYVTGSGVTVTAVQNPSRDVQLDTSVSAPVPTFFMRIFGINTIQATRTSKAEYVLPVPMGSPLNYFGAFGPLRGWIHTDTGLLFPSTFAASGAVPAVPQWTNPGFALVDEAPGAPAYATVNNAINLEVYGGFHIPMPAVATDARFLTDGGIEVVVKAKSSVAACKLEADVTSNASAGVAQTWVGFTSPNIATNDPVTLTTSDVVYTFGGTASSGAADATDWWRTTPASGWTTTNFADGNFAVRLKSVGGAGCTTATISVDYVKVRVNFEQLSPLITGPNGESLNQQGVWATALSQGADIVNGDLYSPENNGSGGNALYTNPSSYYNYAIEMEPGTTNGSIYVFDPVFCATNGNGSQGMGDRWFGSGGMSTFYDLYDTNNTPYDLTDDTWVAGNSGPAGASNPLYNLFRKKNTTDPTQGGPAVSGSVTTCQRGKITDPTNGAYWHNRWWQLGSGLPGPTGVTPRIYRVRVTTTDPASASDQSSTNAQNSFSFFANVSGHTCPTSPADLACPRVYGLGTMEAFSPLNPSSVADLYMSQIGLTYAGKTIKVSLWDPGDTGVLSADLSFLKPTTAGYVVAPFTWTASKIAANGVNCATGGGPAVTSLRTNNGGSSATTGLFNGCLVTINIAVDVAYTAPTPPGEPGAGWWKIRYTTGSGASSAYDLTTWKTQIVGNPVHLVVP